MASAADDFKTLTCRAPLARTQRMAAIAAEVLPSGVDSILDLGCGTGRLTRMLARARPTARVVGLDVSAANIEAAKADPDQLANVRFECADYLTFDGGPFDGIVTDGVLHLIPGGTDTLFAKLATDLTPGGTLICCMPYTGVYNQAFAAVRKVLRAVRTRALDNSILAIGRLLHGKDMPLEQLAERVHYMYLPPTRMMNDALERDVASRLGLHVSARFAMPSTSAAQLRHSVTVFEKAASA
jgi:trans-aconitate methyltransferase